MVAFGNRESLEFSVARHCLTYIDVKWWIFLHRNLKNGGFLRFIYFPYSLWTFISLLSLDFYFPFIFCLFFLYPLIYFPYSIWTFISLFFLDFFSHFYSDFYFPFLLIWTFFQFFLFLFQFFSISFQFFFRSITVTFWISSIFFKLLNLIPNK